MIRHGIWMAAAVWTLSATVAWAEPPAGPPQAVEGPSLVTPANGCSAVPCRRSCWEEMRGWLSYRPQARCSDCGCCHNCTTHQPPLFAFFLEYNGYPCLAGVVSQGAACNGGAGCHGRACRTPGTCKTCANKADTGCAKGKDVHP